jgi:uncharacterized protein YjbI with pentapeptide repeats
LANEKHLEIINQGVEAWNKWINQAVWDYLGTLGLSPNSNMHEFRRARQRLPPEAFSFTVADLSNVDLSGADLSGVDFSHTNLSNVNLSNSRLRKARFSGSNLTHAYLAKADLTEAHLDEADLTKAKLKEANLKNANCEGAKFVGADLSNVEHANSARFKGSDLSGTVFYRAMLEVADFEGVNLTRANLGGTDLWAANLRNANLTQALIYNASLRDANLEDANLKYANLLNTVLSGANLKNADLSHANLTGASLVGANLTNAKLTGSTVFGVSAWEVNLEGAEQKNLVITPSSLEYQPIITVDDLEVAQFVYLLLNNKKIRQVIDTVTSKVVLILGRFTEERKAVLDEIREELRRRDYIPILFDFDQPTSRDIHETVTTLARMARFIIADITSPKSIPQELVSIVEQLPSVPVQPLLKRGSKPWAMYDHIKRYPWVLTLHRYVGLDDLRMSLGEKVVAPAVAKAEELKPGHVA